MFIDCLFVPGLFNTYSCVLLTASFQGLPPSCYHWGNFPVSPSEVWYLIGPSTSVYVAGTGPWVTQSTWIVHLLCIRHKVTTAGAVRPGFCLSWTSLIKACINTCKDHSFRKSRERVLYFRSGSGAVRRIGRFASFSETWVGGNLPIGWCYYMDPFIK